MPLTIHSLSRQSDIRPAQYQLYKVTPVLEHIRKKCLEIESENKFSIDKMTVPYKGTNAGFKIFGRAGISGIVYDFLTYTRKSTFGTGLGPAKELEVGAQDSARTHQSVWSTFTNFCPPSDSLCI